MLLIVGKAVPRPVGALHQLSGVPLEKIAIKASDCRYHVPTIVRSRVYLGGYTGKLSMTKPRKQWEYRFRMKPWSQLLLRLLGRLPLKDDAACSIGRRPRSLKGGNRGPGSLGGAAHYGESGVGRCVVVCVYDRVER